MSDTIAAIATAPGEGGISVVRVSGDGAEAVLGRVFRPADPRARTPVTHVLTYGQAVDADGRKIDECMAVLMRAPRSYTREDVAELQTHGGYTVSQRVLEACLAAGARLAGPGEFTRRAFLNGRIDLSQAEAVMELIRSRGEQARQAALRQLDGGPSAFVREAADTLYGIQAEIAANLDYPEEVPDEDVARDLPPRMRALADRLEKACDERGARILREGLRVALCGRPNAGKSSLLNALTGEDLAIVTPVPGTTRDTVHGEISLDGCAVRLTDTAGLRATDDPVERIGVERAARALEEADTVLFLVDGSVPPTAEDAALAERLRGRDALLVLTKADLPAAFGEAEAAALLHGAPVFRTSCEDPAGLDPLLAALAKRAKKDRLTLTQPRHLEAVRRAAACLRRAADTMGADTTGVNAMGGADLASVDLLAAQQALAEVTGDAVEERLLDRVFADFCVGK